MNLQQPNKSITFRQMLRRLRVFIIDHLIVTQFYWNKEIENTKNLFKIFYFMGIEQHALDENCQNTSQNNFVFQHFVFN